MAPIELVCQRCRYEVCINAGIPSAQQRLTPAECPECGTELVEP